MPRRLSAADRDARYARVVQLRRAKTPWDQVGAQLKVSAARAHQIYQEALAHSPLTSIQVDEHRHEAGEIADLAVRQLMLIATTATVSARTRVEAWSAIRAWEERRAKLFGTDAPTRHEVVTLDALDAQIAALEVQLGAGPGPLGGDDAFSDEIARLEADLAGGVAPGAAAAAAGASS